MKNVSILFLLVLCSTVVFAQKKKPPKILPPPKIEAIKTTEPDEEKQPAHWETQVEPATAMPQRATKNEIKFDTLSLPANATPCPCIHIAGIFDSGLTGNGISAQYQNLKGNVKQVISTEKRDTTVGYWETLLRGNINIISFSKTGMVTENTTKMMDRYSGTFSLASKLVFEYDADNNPIYAKLFFIDTLKPLSTFAFNYDKK